MMTAGMSFATINCLWNWASTGILNMAMTLKIGIKQKLAFIFFLFFLIFSGTVSILLVNVQGMVETTEHIVSNNKKIAEISEVIRTSLLDMDANHKKLKLLKKERYSDFFYRSKVTFESALKQVLQLSSPGQGSTDSAWSELDFSYQRHRSGLWDTGMPPEIGYQWVSDQVVSFWIDRINMAKTQNQKDIDRALRELNERSRTSARNGLYGFCISILLGFCGIWFITRSIFLPLKTLSLGLKRISYDKQHQPICLKGGDEFSELAGAYNDMSRQLYEEETIRSEFIATLSHEIRTPLSSIHESVNMIVEEVFGSINDKQRKFLEIAGIELRRINKLLNYLLNVSVLEDDHRQKNSTTIDTKELVLKSAELFYPLIEKKHLKLKFHGPPDSPMLFGEKEELQQVFVNIIGNAIKYSPENGLVTVFWQKNRGQKFLLFDVIDSGPGIPEDEQSLIFTKYYRTKTVRGHLDGVGLGLAIARRIIVGYGGHIKVTNNSTTGCTFSFTLPYPSKSDKLAAQASSATDELHSTGIKS